MDGHYHVNSTLITELNGTSVPKCHVEAINISTNIIYDCEGMVEDGGTGNYLFLFISERMGLTHSPLLLHIKSITLCYNTTYHKAP